MADDGPVLIEILARKNCDNRGMAITLVERVVEESGIPAQIDVIDVTSLAQAKKRRFLGSPTVRVEGRDVDRGVNGGGDFSLDDRVYRTARGLAGWPDEQWVREAILLAAARTTTNGNHKSSTSSSATSP